VTSGTAAVQLTAGRRVYVVVALLTGFASIAAWLVYLAYCPFPFDPVGYLVGRDFVNTWMSARAALAGDLAPWFDPAAYNMALRQMFGPDYGYHIWSYPPHLLLFTWPLGLLGYPAAYIVWSVVGLAAYLLVVADGRRDPLTLALLVLAPAVIVNVAFGQIGFVTAALMIGGLINIDRRPILSGILFGVLTVKPHFGLMLPIMLILTGRWRVIIAAALTCAALAVLTTAWFGVEVWAAYVRLVIPAQHQFTTAVTGFFMPMMPSVFMNARLFGLTAQTASLIQGVFTVMAIGAVIWTYWRPRDPGLSAALLITATFVALPHCFNYDMVMFAWPLLLLYERRDNEGVDYGYMLAIWMLPVIGSLLGLFGSPVSSLFLIAFAGRLIRRLVQAEEASARRAGPAQAFRPHTA
jgi:alpha-1,2-mannosyltransferase